MRVAVVHDYFTQSGGAEKVAEELYGLAPGATLVSTVALQEKLPASLRDVPIETSWLQNMPGMKDHYRLYFLLYPFAVHSLDLSRFDLVLSSSSGYAKGIRTHGSSIHVCYCHTPMRWVWNFHDYSKRERMGLARRVVLPALIGMLRVWDKDAARQPDHFIANSRAVAQRIAKVYGRTAEVIHPPIDVDRFRISRDLDDYYVVLSRLIPYKRIDLAVQACTLLRRRLLVIGEGPQYGQLLLQAGPTVTFTGRLSDSEVERVVSRCRALIFPGEEDFGMAPIEVAAAGRPCIAYRAGGALETVREGVTGCFFDEQTPQALAAAIEMFETLEWSPTALRMHANGFRREVFQEKMRKFLSRAGCPLPRDHSQLQNLERVALQGDDRAIA
jgi:glycosyltransferase involved in cell wall biosynthesis